MARGFPGSVGSNFPHSKVINFPLGRTKSSQEKWLLWSSGILGPPNPTAAPPRLSPVPPTPDSPHTAPVHTTLPLLGSKVGSHKHKAYDLPLWGKGKKEFKKEVVHFSPAFFVSLQSREYPWSESLIFWSGCSRDVPCVDFVDPPIIFESWFLFIHSLMGTFPGLAKGLNPYQDHLCLELASRCGWNPIRAHTGGHLLMLLFFKFFYCCSITVVPIFPPLLSPALPTPPRCFYLTPMLLPLSLKSIDYILYTSSSFKSHIFLIGWGKEGSVQQQNYKTSWWQGPHVTPSSESQSWAPAAALPPWSLQPVPPQPPFSSPSARSSSAKPQPPHSYSASFTTPAAPMAWKVIAPSLACTAAHRPWLPVAIRVQGPAQGRGHRDKFRHQGVATVVAFSLGGYCNFLKLAPAPNLHSQIHWAGQQRQPLHQKSPSHLPLRALAGRQTHTYSHTHPHTPCSHSLTPALTHTQVDFWIDCSVV